MPNGYIIEISKWAFILRISKVISPYLLVTFFNMNFLCNFKRFHK